MARPPKWRYGVEAHKLTYISWQNMRIRCLKPYCKSYDRYGGRGISICDRWLNDFDAFFEDMGMRPAGMTLERKNNQGNYEPENCCWATRKTQNSNTSRNHEIEFQGETKNLKDWADIFGTSLQNLGQCLKRNSVHVVFGRFQRLDL